MVQASTPLEVTVRRADVVKLLAAHRGDLANRYGVQTIDVFGSVSRDDARPGSDVDLLVTFEERPTARAFFDLKAHLEELLGSPRCAGWGRATSAARGSRSEAMSQGGARGGRRRGS
jgi:predicted nucleotidyltransferase